MLAAAVATWGVGDVLAGTTFGSTAILTTSSGSTLLSVSTAASSVVGAAVSVIGKAEVQSLFPSSGKTTLLKIESTPASYSISGNENVTAPFSVMPKVYGQRRIYPMLAAPSFNESGGNSHNELYTNEYLRMLFVLGYGPLDVTELKIGDTLLSDYEDVEWEVRAGYPDDAPPSLYTGAVMETSFNIQLVKSGNPPQTLGWQTQTTGEGADEIAIQITWPEGFWEVNNVGNDHGEHMRIQAQYRLHGGTGAWSTRPDFIASGPSKRTLAYTDRWAVPNGQYDVQVQVERTARLALRDPLHPRRAFEDHITPAAPNIAARSPAPCICWRAQSWHSACASVPGFSQAAGRGSLPAHSTTHLSPLTRPASHSRCAAMRSVALCALDAQPLSPDKADQVIIARMTGLHRTSGVKSASFPA